MATVHDVEFAVMLSATTNDYDMPDSEYADAFERLGVAAEESGFDAVLAGDHIAYPDAIESSYPFTPTGDPPFDSATPVHDVFQVLSYVAASTDEVRLGTNVCVAPMRHPVLLAKNVLTLDSLAGGRVELGVGVGWLAEEFDVLDVPFDERGGRLDEFLELLEQVRTEQTVSFDGEFVAFPPTGFSPRPQGSIPVWFGGGSGATCRRIAEFGTGWTGILSSPGEVGTMRERIGNAWADFDRPGTPEMAVLRPVDVRTDESDDDKLLVGSPGEVRQDIVSFANAGTTRLVLDFFTRDVDEQVRQIRRFGEHVINE